MVISNSYVRLPEGNHQFYQRLCPKKLAQFMPQMLSLTGRLILIGRLGDDQAACGSGGDVFDLSQWTAEKGWVTAW